MTLPDLLLRLRALVVRRRVDEELDEELAFHLEMQTRTHLSAGVSETDAERLARVRFGSAALVADQCRDARGIGFIETLWQDVRYAARSFRRAPAFALTVVGTRPSIRLRISPVRSSSSPRVSPRRSSLRC